MNLHDVVKSGWFLGDQRWLVLMVGLSQQHRTSMRSQFLRERLN